MISSIVVDSSRRSQVHVAYEVTGIEDWQARLRDLGADIVWDLRVHEDVMVLFLRDNTGNLVELVEPVEPPEATTSGRG